jgi:hypothetical protein
MDNGSLAKLRTTQEYLLLADMISLSSMGGGGRK